ncbi:MAG: response regulator [Prolixibacteraceae bacterium]|nr:response regulator [Prolixibacteraceae bacterium]
MIDPTLKNSNILIVDDQEANIDVLEGFLEMQGYINIKTTQDPRQVLDLYSTFDPDLILLDLSMPYMSGFEVMEQLKSTMSPNTFLPILVLTADVSPVSKQRALAGGASDFLTKPFDLVEVGLRIRNLLYTSFLHQKLKNQNFDLEEKVKERTEELETRNIELSLAKEKAEASDRLKSSFINNISHEIRTPLNGILGFGQILTDTELMEDEKALYLKLLNESSARLINTVTNFMDISLLSSGNQKIYKKNVRLESMIVEVVNKFADLCEEKNVSLTLQAPPQADDIRVFTDNDLVIKILCQLLDNAVKFTHQGTIKVAYEVVNNNLQFSVCDTGIGISDENKSHIFESFIQEDFAITRKYEGSGLGLTISRGFVKLLGGKIWLESEKGLGSDFYFSIPYNVDSTPQNQENKPVETKTRGYKQTILIAEDDDINFKYFVALLSHSTIDILRATNGIEAIAICREHPEVELVLMDLRMRDMDGFEATTKIKTFRSNLPIIAITAYSELEDKKMAMKAGCDEFITKPVKKDFLIKKLEDFGIYKS